MPKFDACAYTFLTYTDCACAAQRRQNVWLTTTTCTAMSMLNHLLIALIVELDAYGQSIAPETRLVVSLAKLSIEFQEESSCIGRLKFIGKSTSKKNSRK